MRAPVAPPQRFEPLDRPLVPVQLDGVRRELPGGVFRAEEGEFGVDPTCGTRLLTNSSGTRPPPEPFEPLDPLDEGADGLSCALGVSGAMGASPPSSSESTLRLDRERSLSPVGLVPSIIAGGGSEKGGGEREPLQRRAPPARPHVRNLHPFRCVVYFRGAEVGGVRWGGGASREECEDDAQVAERRRRVNQVRPRTPVRVIMIQNRLLSFPPLPLPEQR
eukprot:CAMPEP_0180305112 /NCGR_PEP_ID=MMETSP0988-20121125/26190_1 /TAXON_ID=697907 /ORGANISM="non described non described, Strain CCMP2293" /LENGTH=219 /DNA_ID=CAMNT_0022287399 /DNA_START=938 /DNA_END=1594 /DNA_ORIENTATION=+